jgi:hypothetical protein
VLLYLPLLILALHFNCASNALYGLTGGTSAFESFAFARSFVRINRVTGAASVLCSLASRCASLSELELELDERLCTRCRSLGQLQLLVAGH